MHAQFRYGLVAILTGLGLVLTGPFASAQISGQPAAGSAPPSAEEQPLVAKAQAAIDSAGGAARQAFEVKTGVTTRYPVSGPSVGIVHKASGLVCVLSDEIEIRIKVYHKNSKGEATDVSCDMTYLGTTHTLYAYQRADSSISDELNAASLGITSRFTDARLEDKSPFDLFEESNRFLTLRDYDTIKDTEARAYRRPFQSPRGFYETVWVGKAGDWYIKQRSSAPGYYNFVVSGLWHAVWRNLLPERVAEEDRHTKELVETRLNAETANAVTN